MILVSQNYGTEVQKDDGSFYMILESYTYFKNENERRAFLLTSFPTELHPNEPVKLLEWGKDRALTVKLDDFLQLIDKGLMKPFIPTL